MPKKPSGISGFFQVRVDAQGQVSGAFEQTPFPSQKPEIERQMVVSFIASMNKHLASTGDCFVLSNPRQNAEDGFDFTVDACGNAADLELMEIAPLKGPYESAPSSHRPYDFAKAILNAIQTKSGRYPPSQGRRDLFLLLYTTHWSLLPSDLTLACLRYWCTRESLAFRAIFLFHLIELTEGEPAWIFPYPPDLLGAFDPELVRDNVCLNFDPRKFVVMGGNES